MAETGGPKTQPQPTKMSGFPGTFYVACTMEVFERMAWYGFFALSSLYITSPVVQGGLGFSSVQRGILQGVIPFLLYLFPVITGALADRYGYRNTFLVAFSILTPAYYLLGQFHSFWGFFGIFLLVAAGAATFKPVVVGTVGRTTDDTNRGLGFGIFYMIVNVGGFVGPVVAGYVRAISWDWVFVASAGWIALNFIPTLFFYKEPTSEADSKEKRSLGKVLLDAQEVLGNGRFALMVVPILVLVMVSGGGWLGWTITLALSAGWIALNLLWNTQASSRPGAPWFLQKAKIGNWPFVTYLMILAGFWASFNQIFITMPEYIRDFVDTSDMVEFAAIFGQGFVDFLAAVNVEQLAAALGTIADETVKAGTLTDPDALRHAFLEIVNYKVRPPMEEISAALTQLTAAGKPSAAALTQVAQEWATRYRQVNPEYIVNIDAGAIVIFQVLVSWIIQRWSPFPVLVVGTIISGIGIAMGSIALAGFTVILAIVVFAFGEMIASPKSQEYVARIAPGDKVALFMGYYFVSIALGNLVGGILSGWGYGVLAIEHNNPEAMWILFGGIGFLTAAALLIFNRFVVPRLEAQRAANVG